MNSFVKTGISVGAIAVLSLVGFSSAFGYGGGGGSSGGGGWVDPRCYNPVKPSAGGFRFVGIPGHDTYSRDVKFDIDGGDAEFMMISDKQDFAGAVVEPYSKTKAMQLAAGYGSKWVYARFFNHCRIPTNIFSWNFNYRAPGRVLGQQVYADGTLLRGSDKKVYIVKGNTLVYIPSLAELFKHVGKAIVKVEDSVITGFADINNQTETATVATGEVLGETVIKNGSLVRGSDKKVYVIIDGKKVHVRSLDQLVKNYRGKVILDVADSVLAQY